MTDQISLDRLNKLHPLVRLSAIDAYLEACRLTPSRVHPFITETERSFERSEELYAQGRTRPGQVVTNAKSGDSLHNYRMAIDFVLLINGKESWKVDKNWMIVVNCFKKRGWKWGGDFKSFKDAPHLENTMGLTLAKIKSKYKAKDFIPGNKYLNIVT